MEEMSNVACVPVHFFFTAAHFHLGGRQHFSFSHRRYKIFTLFFQQKNVSLVIFSRASFLSLFFALSFAGLSPTFSFSLSFLFLYISIFVDMTISVSLILQTTRIQKQFPLSVFVFIDSLVVSVSQDEGSYAIPAKITSSCIRVAKSVD